MNRVAVLVAVTVVVAASSSASGQIVYGTKPAFTDIVTVDNTTTPDTVSGTNIEVLPTNQNNLNNSLSTLDQNEARFSLNSGLSESFTMTFLFTGHGGGTDFILWTGFNVADTFLTRIDLQERNLTTGAIIESNFATGSQLITEGGSGVTQHPHRITGFTFDNPSSGFDFADYNIVVLTFLQDDGEPAAVPDMVVNAFSNPEPGTLALFALGILGLGGFAVRRRRRRPRAST